MTRELMVKLKLRRSEIMYDLYRIRQKLNLLKHGKKTLPNEELIRISKNVGNASPVINVK